MAQNSWAQQLKQLFQLQPAVVRGLLVAVTGVIAQVLGKTVIDNDSIEVILNAYTALSALVGAFWIRPSVTPHLKVVSFKPDPFASPTVMSGPAAGIDAGDALGTLDEPDNVDVEVPPVDDPDVIQQDTNVVPIQTDNSARPEDGDQSRVSQEPVADYGDQA